MRQKKFNIELLIAQMDLHDNMSQRELARRVGVRHGTVQNWFGGSTPSDTNIRRVADIFKMNASDFLMDPFDLLHSQYMTLLYQIFLREILNYYYRERALIHYNKGYFESAIYALDEAIRIDFNDADSHFWRGRSNYELNRYTETVTDFDTVININSNNGYAFYWRGMAKRDLRQYAEAISDFDKAISLNPTDARSNGRIYYSRGMAKKQIGVFSSARRDFDIALMCAEEIGDYNLQTMIK